MRKESDFQGDLIKEIKTKLPGAIVTKLDPKHIQGLPDLLILYKNKWAALECKKNEYEMRHPRPNQPYYVNLMNNMSFAAFIFPGNKEEVLNDLQRALESGR
ncbi:MAG: hypothetical protein IJ880_17595 [Bacilli bacterium]|nr:hypothetical protein [Bacilli bacterium]